ncbi:MAG TPA: tetratricopeptide repeat protein [Terriglobales bacterium]|nr:tetratricopeptide repeat protein [Terriglobales bacterium]
MRAARFSSAAMADLINSEHVIRFGVFELDVSAGELRKRGVRLSIQGLPLQILSILTANPGTVVTREELRNRLWPANRFVDFDHSIRNAVARLREALEDSAETPRYVETLPRRGYRFIGPIESSHRSPSALAAQADGTSQPIADGTSQPINVTPRSSKQVLALIAAGAIIAVGALTAFFWSRPTASSPTIRSLAVLPLKNLSGDPSQDYLADGMTEDLIGQLTNIRNLRVISRTSAMQFKDTRLTVPEIAQKLRVDAVVEGSVVREGSRIQVHAQLIRAATDEHFWSETYDRDVQDVLALEGDVAQSIARKVEVTITGREQERLAAARPIPSKVYESYLKGRFVFNNSPVNRKSIEESIGYFQEAINSDPTFAPAYLGLAVDYAGLGTVFIGAAPPGDARSRATSAVRKALELDPDSVEAHVLLADLLAQQWHWAEANAEYRRALELNPNDADAHDGLAAWLLCQGRFDEALAEGRRGRELDPLAVSGADIGWILFHSRRYDEAVQEYRSAIAVKPDSANGLWQLGFALMFNHQSQEAIPVVEKSVSLSGRSPGAIAVLISAYANGGRRSDALRLVAELKNQNRTRYVPPGAFVIAYLGLNDREQALAWLEQSYKEQSNILQFLKVHPIFDPLRNDPRFVDLMRRVGLN